MRAVQPIRDKNKLTEIMQVLLTDYKSKRNFVMFAVGIGSAYRITDMLKLRVRDVRKKDHFILTESKTGKVRRMRIDPDLRKVLDEYIAGKSDDEYLFPSRQRNRLGEPKQITRSTVYKILNKAAAKVGLYEEIGCHSMRKTFGYHHYQRYRDAVTLMELLGHSKVEITLRYIGITQDMLDKTVMNLRILKGVIPANSQSGRRHEDG